MADALGQPPVVAESLQTRTPLDPRVKALARAQEHDEELRQRWQSQLPPMLACPRQHAAPHVHNPVSGARGHTR